MDTNYVTTTAIMSFWFDKTIANIERFFWRADQKIDANTEYFFVFKPFPKGLTKEERTKWSQLQVDLLSPFKHSYTYQYNSRKGTHLWFSKRPFDGIPETAAQTSMKDGSHVLMSSNYTYKQVWEDGLMVACVAIPTTSETTNKLQYSQKTFWAMPRKLETAVKKTSTWYGVVITLFCVYLFFIAAAWATTFSQRVFLTDYNEQLSDEIGPKLNMREKLSRAQTAIDALYSWQYEYQAPPIVVGLALKELNAISSIIVNRIQWQNNQLQIEFVSDDINITQLVAQSEKINGVKTANIRPHNDTNTWVLEIQW